MEAAAEPGSGVEDVLEGDEEDAAIDSLNTVDRSDWEPEVETLFFDRVNDREFDELGEVYRSLRKGRKHNRLLGFVLLGRTGMNREQLSKVFKTNTGDWFQDYTKAGLWDEGVTGRGKKILGDIEGLKSDLGSDQWRHEKSTMEALNSLDFSGDLGGRLYREVVDETDIDTSLPEKLRGKVDDYQYLGEVFKALSGDRLKVFAHYAGHDTGYSHNSLGNFIGRSSNMVGDAMDRFYELDLMYEAGNELTFMGEKVFEMIQRHYEALDDEGF
ncbi:MAG: hypothetical protein ABEJ98_03915 [Candidatus Nanohaloarchaea archaeon]